VTGEIIPLRPRSATQHGVTRPQRPIEATWPEYGRIEGTDAELYASAGEEGDVLLTIDSQSGLDDVRRTVLDTELDREAAARAILQLVIAYGVDERILGALVSHGDEALVAASEEWGW
jgi:hypothetical protein